MHISETGHVISGLCYLDALPDVKLYQQTHCHFFKPHAQVQLTAALPTLVRVLGVNEMSNLTGRMLADVTGMAASPVRLTYEVSPSSKVRGWVDVFGASMTQTMIKHATLRTRDMLGTVLLPRDSFC